MAPQHKRFAVLWLSLTLGGLLAIALFNLLVDSGGSYPALHLKRLEHLRYLRHDRISKGEMANRGDWELVILGSSRAKAGMPANHPAFQTNRTCNLSLDAITFAELQSVFEFTRHRNPLKQVLLCVDFYMFCMPPNWILEFPQSRFNPEHDRLVLQCRRLLTEQALDDSFYVAKRYSRGYQPSPQNCFGFLDISLSKSDCQRLIFDRTMHVVGVGYLRQQLEKPNLELFRKLVRTCREEGIRLDIVIVPVHALDLEFLYSGNRWQDFEFWKTSLTDILAEESSPAPLWDFTAYSGPPAEPVPPLGDTTTRMKYYLENSHFTPALGTVVVDTVLGTNQLPGFGFKLDRSNVRQHLEKILQDRQAYVQQFPAEIAWVKKIIAEVTPPPPKGTNHLAGR